MYWLINCSRIKFLSYILNIYTKILKIDLAIVLQVDIWENFTSIKYDHIASWVIIDLQLKNLIFFVFKTAISQEFFERVNKVVPIYELLYY